MFERTFVDATNENFATLLPIAFLVMLVGANLLLRSTLATLAIVFVSVFATATALGFPGWIGMVLTPPSPVSQSSS